DTPVPPARAGQRRPGATTRTWLEGRGATGAKGVRERSGAEMPNPREYRFRRPSRGFRAIPANGGCGIRTHGGVAPTTAFKTVAFNHSANPPRPPGGGFKTSAIGHSATPPV